MNVDIMFKVPSIEERVDIARDNIAMIKMSDKWIRYRAALYVWGIAIVVLTTLSVYNLFVKNLQSFEVALVLQLLLAVAVFLFIFTVRRGKGLEDDVSVLQRIVECRTSSPVLGILARFNKNIELMNVLTNGTVIGISLCGTILVCNYLLNGEVGVVTCPINCFHKVCDKKDRHTISLSYDGIIFTSPIDFVDDKNRERVRKLKINKLCKDTSLLLDMSK